VDGQPGFYAMRISVVEERSLWVLIEEQVALATAFSQTVAS
jgi:hypothetical protein